MARNKHPEETRSLIINTAARLFAKKGYDHTSIQDIIDHLGGLSKGAIYHHFKSKEEIMMAVADEIYSESEVTLRRILVRKDLNAREKLKELFNVTASNPGQKDMFSFAPDMLKNPQLLVLFLQGTVQREATNAVYEILEEGITDGSIQTEYPKQLAETLILLANIWLNPMVYHCTPEEQVSKVKFYQYLLKLLGLDILEDEMIGQIESYARIYKESITSLEK